MLRARANRVKISQTDCTLGDRINCQSYVTWFVIKHKNYFTTEAVKIYAVAGRCYIFIYCSINTHMYSNRQLRELRRN
jgi:hypothetical protein